MCPSGDQAQKLALQSKQRPEVAIHVNERITGPRCGAHARDAKHVSIDIHCISCAQGPQQEAHEADEKLEIDELVDGSSVPSWDRHFVSRQMNAHAQDDCPDDRGEG